jgi:hypothetical protein
MGAPVTALNIDDTQVDDCIDMALLKYQRNHYNGSELVYTPYLITQTEKTNKYVVIPPAITGVTKLFQIVTGSTSNVLSANYIMASDAVWQAMRGTGMVNYQMLMNYRSLIDGMMNVEKPIRFQRTTGKLRIDTDWANINIGDYVVIEGYSAIDPLTNTLIWSDEFLQDLAVAYIKRETGMVLSKYSGVQLPGGITLDGRTMLEDAKQEIEQLEIDLRDRWSLPPMMSYG